MDARRRNMRGFSLLEAVVSVAILAGAVLALTTAMLGSTHDTSQLLARQTLTDVATDVLTDLRVSAAYQPEVLDELAAHPPQPFTVTRRTASGGTYAVRVAERLARLGTSPGYAVTITATAPDGRAESLQQTVAQEAVAPGSTVTQAPDATAPPASAATPGCVERGTCWPGVGGTASGAAP